MVKLAKIKMNLFKNEIYPKVYGCKTRIFFFFLLRHDLIRKVLFLLLVIYPFQKRCTRDFRRDFVNASVDLYASSLSSTAAFWINLFSHSTDPWEMYWLGANSSCVNTGVITNVI